MIQYWNQDGAPADRWGTLCFDGVCNVYNEQNLTVQPYQSMDIYEPCNYASNIPYYHITTQFCDHSPKWTFPAETLKAIGTVFPIHTVGK